MAIIAFLVFTKVQAQYNISGPDAIPGEEQNYSVPRTSKPNGFYVWRVRGGVFVKNNKKELIVPGPSSVKIQWDESCATLCKGVGIDLEVLSDLNDPFSQIGLPSFFVVKVFNCECGFCHEARKEFHSHDDET